MHSRSATNFVVVGVLVSVVVAVVLPVVVRVVFWHVFSNSPRAKAFNSSFKIVAVCSHADA